MDPFYSIRFQCAQAKLLFHHFMVKGTDAGTFLHGQTTGQVLALAPQHFSVQAFVDRTGKIETQFYLLRTHGGFEILAPLAGAAHVQSRFEKFVISEDAELEDLGAKSYWLTLGPKTTGAGFQGLLGGELASLSPAPGAQTPVIDRSVLMDFLSWQGEPLPDETYHTGELINQTRLFDVAVDMTKGCYPGQETVAKVHHNRGAAWAPVLLKATPPEQTVPSEIMLEGKKVAKVSQQDYSAGERWCIAEVLRDVRVENLVIQGEGTQKLKVQSYPRFSTKLLDKAQHFFYLGTDAFQAEDADGALKAWEQAIELAPDYADPYEAIGVLLGRLDRLDEAIDWMKKLLVVDPQSVMAHTNLSLFLMKQGKIKEAEDHKTLATVASFASFGKSAQAKEAQELEQKKAEAERAQRESMFRQVLEIDPEDALANFGLGGLCFERSQFEEAKALFETVLKSDPQYSVAYLGLGKTLLKLGESARAKVILEAGVKVAAKKGDMMPANEMQGLLSQLG